VVWRVRFRLADDPPRNFSFPHRFSTVRTRLTHSLSLSKTEAARWWVSLKKQRTLLPVGVMPKPRVFSSGAGDLTRNRPSA